MSFRDRVDCRQNLTGRHHVAKHAGVGARGHGGGHVVAQALGQLVLAHGPRHVLAGIEHAQHAHGRGVRCLARHQVGLVHQVVEHRAVAARLADQADRLDQVLRDVRLRVDGAQLRAVAHVRPLPGNSLQRLADGLDVGICGVEHLFHDARIPVGGLHQRGLDALAPVLRQLPVASHHPGHVLSGGLQLANERAHEVAVGRAGDLARLVHAQHARIHQRCILARELGRTHAQALALALGGHVGGVVGFRIHAHQHRVRRARNHLGRDAVHRLVGQHAAYVLAGRAHLMRGTDASGATVVQRLDRARRRAVEVRVLAAIGKVRRVDLRGIHHGVAERHTLAVAHHGHVLAAEVLGRNRVQLVAHRKHHRRATVRRAARPQAHVIGVAGDVAHLHHGRSARAVTVLQVHARLRLQRRQDGLGFAGLQRVVLGFQRCMLGRADLDLARRESLGLGEAPEVGGGCLGALLLAGFPVTDHPTVLPSLVIYGYRDFNRLYPSGFHIGSGRFCGYSSSGGSIASCCLWRFHCRGLRGASFGSLRCVLLILQGGQKFGGLLALGGCQVALLGQNLQLGQTGGRIGRRCRRRGHGRSGGSTDGSSGRRARRCRRQPNSLTLDVPGIQVVAAGLAHVPGHFGNRLAEPCGGLHHGVVHISLAGGGQLTQVFARTLANRLHRQARAGHRGLAADRGCVLCGSLPCALGCLAQRGVLGQRGFNCGPAGDVHARIGQHLRLGSCAGFDGLAPQRLRQHIARAQRRGIHRGDDGALDGTLADRLAALGFGETAFCLVDGLAAGLQQHVAQEHATQETTDAAHNRAPRPQHRANLRAQLGACPAGTQCHGAVGHLLNHKLRGPLGVVDHGTAHVADGIQHTALRIGLLAALDLGCQRLDGLRALLLRQLLAQRVVLDIGQIAAEGVTSRAHHAGGGLGALPDGCASVRQDIGDAALLLFLMV